MNDEERRTAKGWNDPPLYTFDQINKANQSGTCNASHPLHRKYKYPSAESHPQPNVPQNAYGVQQPQTSVYSTNIGQQPFFASNNPTSFGQQLQAEKQECHSYQNQWNPQSMPQQSPGGYGTASPMQPVMQQPATFQQPMQTQFTGSSVPPMQPQLQNYVQQPPQQQSYLQQQQQVPTQYSTNRPAW